MPAMLAGALVTAGVVTSAVAATTSTTPYINLRVNQARDSGGHTVVSVWMSTNAGRQLPIPTGGGEPLVFTQPGDTACQADPRRPLPGGRTQLVYSGVNNNVFVTWQPAVSFPTSHAQQLTVCAYFINIPDSSFPFAVMTTAHASIVVLAPRRRSTLPFNRGPWRTCSANRANQLLRVQAYTRLANGCQKATTISKTWIAQWRGSFEERDNWGSGWLPSGNLTYPQVKWTSVPVKSLHRTLMCQETAVTPHYQLSDLIVNCGLATFRFAPSL